MGWAVFVEPRLLIVREVSVESVSWPRDRPPLRIALVADLHVGSPFNDLDRVDKIVDAVNAAYPQIVLLLGDYVSVCVVGGRAVSPELIAPRLSRLHAEIAIVAVLGNADWLFDGERIRRAFAESGIPVLENAVTSLDTEHGPVALAGIADDSTRTPDVAGTLATVPDNQPVIVAAHDPATFLEVPSTVVATFAGHTHGGQVSLPFIGALRVPGRAPRAWAHGHVLAGKCRMYVSAGLGTSFLPMRFNMPPAIEIVTLRSAAIMEQV
ncbi:MAG: metallophosphoesterase [Alphaproteobacteria bacterium]